MVSVHLPIHGKNITGSPAGIIGSERQSVKIIRWGYLIYPVRISSRQSSSQAAFLRLPCPYYQVH